MASGRSDLVEIAAEARADREKSIAIYDGTTDDNGLEVWVWLPKSQIEDNGDGTYTMPEWLAHEKGLI